MVVVSEKGIVEEIGTCQRRDDDVWVGKRDISENFPVCVCVCV